MHCLNKQREDTFQNKAENADPKEQHIHFYSVYLTTGKSALLSSSICCRHRLQITGYEVLSKDLSRGSFQRRFRCHVTEIHFNVINILNILIYSILMYIIFILCGHCK